VVLLKACDGTYSYQAGILFATSIFLAPGYRLNRDRDVVVYCLVIVNDGFVSFGHCLDELLRRKAGLADTTIGRSGMEALTASAEGCGLHLAILDRRSARQLVTGCVVVKARGSGDCRSRTVRGSLGSTG
jgi:hypothetical protein